MAAETGLQTITQDWTLVASGKKTVALQLTNKGRVAVYVADTSVPPDEDSQGLIIARNYADTPGALSLAGLPEDTDVWCRSTGDETEELLVLSF